MKLNFITASVIFFLLQLNIVAAKESDLIHRQIKWQEPISIPVAEDQNKKALHFNGAASDEDNVPFYSENFALTGNVNSVRTEILNAQFQPLKEVDLLPKNFQINSELVVTSKIGYHKKQPYALITFSPFRKNASGIIERLVSFDLKITPLGYASQNAAARYYTHNSVLANGTWYKIALNHEGIYKLSYQFLKNLGIDVDNIDPRNLKVYGNGGGMLPLANSIPRFDDLQQNAIYVAGESDGHFNQNDYVLFYGQSPNKWTYNSTDKKFHHQVNLYSDSTYYFITVGGGGIPKRIQQEPSSSLSPTHYVNSFDDYLFHEADLVNFIKSGRQWFGEQFDVVNNSRNFDFSFPNLSSGEKVKIGYDAAGRSINSNCAFTASANSQTISSISISGLGSNPNQYTYANESSDTNSFLTGSSAVTISLQFSANDNSAIGWLNYIELNARCDLNFSGAGNQLEFRDTRSVGNNNVAQYTISNINSNVQVWDITDPVNVMSQQTITSGSDLSFNVPADIMHQFIAFNGSNFYTANAVGKVVNQNLHSLPQTQMIILSHPDFLSEANKLADLHRTHDHLSVVVVTNEQVYNEFSSGAPDISAVRDFMKMFYDRASLSSDYPKYLLLMGDASYDNKNRLPSNTNFILSYQSENSLSTTSSYISDDFFGLLDDSEGQWNTNDNDLLDISVGRLPVKTPSEASGVVNKIITYASADPSVSTVSCNDQSGSVFGDWRNLVTFVADDQDFNSHLNNTETLTNYVKQHYPVYNIDKIYLDAYKQVTTPGGQRYPDARAAIVNRIQRGTLLMNYVGHGGEVGWAHERVLEVEDINGWTNSKNLAAFMTATCEFSRVDDPARTSAGELVLLNPNGGGIGLYTTSRLAFAGTNESLEIAFYRHFFEPVNGKMPTMGDIFEQTKIDFNSTATRNFLLLGDPALTLAYPKWNVKTNSVNAIPVSASPDTIKALSKVTITGEVQDRSGNKLTNFNGIIYPTVYDKIVIYKTLGQDSTVLDNPDSPVPFALQKNVLYRGKASVRNGDFTFTFVVPRDISFQYGFGRLSYYSTNGTDDANGYYENIVIGGVNASAGNDTKGPDVRLYMNDDKFVFGGLTDENPFLYAVISDTSGINTVGNGIGHDITAQLDNDNKELFVLNDFYQADLNNYQKGSVKYKLLNLSEGRHSLKFKVWDVYNNSSEAYTEFVVAASATLALNHVLNYPNPFSTHTRFMFEYNCPCNSLEVMVQIFTISGKLVKTIDQRVLTDGYRSDSIEWDGLDDYGDRIGRGVYIYKLKVRVPGENDRYAEKFEKLVILK